MRLVRNLTYAGIALCLLTPFSEAAGQKEPKGEPASPGVDRNGDALPEGAIARFGSKRLRHSNVIYATAFSPDSKFLASASADGSVRVWEVSSGKEKRAFTYNGEQQTSVAYFKDGKTIAAASINGTIRILDVENGKEKHALTGHAQNLLVKLAISSDGLKIYSASFDGSVREWDVDKAKEARSITINQGPITALALSRDDKKLAIAVQAGNGGFKVFETENAKEVLSLSLAKGQIESLAFTADGKSVALGGGAYQSTFGLYDVQNGKEVQAFRSNNFFGAVKGVAFSPSGKVLATCTQGSNVVLWGVASGKELRRLDIPGTFATHIAYAPDGKTVAVACQDNMIHLFDVEAGKELHEANGFTGAVQQIRFTADGKTIVASDGHGTLRAFEVTSGKDHGSLRAVPYGSFASWGMAADGKNVVYAGYDRSLRFWDPVSGKEVRRFDAFPQIVYAMVISNDGKTLAMMENNRVLHLYSAESGKEIKQFTAAQNQNFGHLAGVSSDGRRVAASGFGPVYVWDVPSGAVLWKGDVNNNLQIQQTVFSPDGKTLACVTANQVRILEIVSRQERLHIERPHDNPTQPMFPTALTFSPDGVVLAVAMQNGEVFLHDVATGKEIGKFKGHMGVVNALAFSPDGRMLASGGGDATVVVWDAAGPIKKNRPEITAPRDTEIASLWQDLTGEAAKAHRLMWAMTAEPKKSVESIKEKLQPGPPADPKRITKLIGDLDNEDFDTREKASEALAGIPEAEPDLKKALENNPSIEKKRRIEALLENRKPGVVGAEQIREARAVEALELIGTAEAKQLLEKLAKGPEDAMLTQECKAALERLAKRDAGNR